MPTIVEKYDDHGQLVSRVEIPDTAAEVNLATLTAQAVAAFNTNRAAIAATAPTTAQVIAQVKNLSAQNNAIMRILLGLLDGTN